MLTMVYTTYSYTVVYNLFFFVAWMFFFCLPVVMCYGFDMSLALMNM